MGCHSPRYPCRYSHLADTAAAADKAASKNEAKYRQLANSRIPVPVATELAETWSQETVKLVQEMYWQIKTLVRPTTVLVPAAVSGTPTRKCGLFPQHFHQRVNPAMVYTCVVISIFPLGN